MTTADAGRRRGSRRVVSQTGSSEASGSDADAARPNSSERPDSGFDPPWLVDGRPLRIGEIATVKIERADAYDLHGTAVGF